MAKDKNNGKNKNGKEKNGKEVKKDSLLSSWTKRWIKAILMFLAAIIIVLSFPVFDKAGYAGKIFVNVSLFSIGKSFYVIPLLLFVAGLIFLRSRKKGKNLAMLLAIVVSIIGISGILAAKNLTVESGGWAGYLLAKLFVGFFGILVANIIFGAILLIGLFIFLQFIWQEIPKEKLEEEKRPSFVLNRPENENVKIKGVVEDKQEKPSPAQNRISLFRRGGMDDQPEKKEIRKSDSPPKGAYILPPLDLLQKNESAPTSGNIKENSMIIKNTLDNFGIPVEMAEVNVGPTVTQYAFKPAEGVKLSKKIGR